MTTEGERVYFDSVQIQALIPHRYPFLLLDKIVEWEDNTRIVGVKNVTINEEFFLGHFPGKPVMPGVLILEAMAQTGAILARTSTKGVLEPTIIYLAGVNDVKWKRQVVPGDSLYIEMVVRKCKRPWWMMDGTVTVQGKVVASAAITAYVAPPEKPGQDR